MTLGCGARGEAEASERHASPRAGLPAPLPPADAFPDLASPGPGAAVEVLPFDGTTGRSLRVLLDAGHGAEGNHGNTSTYGVAEEEFTLDLALDVAAQLEATGAFEVQVSRGAGERVAYAARIEAARAMAADAFVSLHSDVRGTVRSWSPVPGLEARAALDAPGFSVLFADEGDVRLAERRRGLAAAVATAMHEAGFFPYGGAEYQGLYAPDAVVPGAFVDRHEPGKRIFVLRRAPMPSIIVETHNALDPREAARWDEEHARRAFAMALARGLAAALAPPDPG
jgi:N-acetylmuramoyl-L-alanine amidase